MSNAMLMKNFTEDIGNNLTIESVHSRLIFEIKDQNLKEQISGHYQLLNENDLKFGSREVVDDKKVNYQAYHYIGSVMESLFKDDYEKLGYL